MDTREILWKERGFRRGEVCQPCELGLFLRYIIEY